eukprot:Rmarinus@m.26902
MHSAVHVGTSAMITPVARNGLRSYEAQRDRLKLSIRRLDSMLIDSPISLGTYYWAMIRRVGLLASKISLNLPSKSSTTCLTLTVMLTFSIIYANCSLPVTKKKKVVHSAQSHAIQCHCQGRILRGRPDILIMAENCCDDRSWKSYLANVIAAIELKNKNTTGDAGVFQAKAYAVLLWLWSSYQFLGVVLIRGDAATLYQPTVRGNRLQFRVLPFSRGRRDALVYLLHAAGTPGSKGQPKDLSALGLFTNDGGGGDRGDGGGRSGNRGSGSNRGDGGG